MNLSSILTGDVAQISAGAMHSLILSSEGQAYAVGENSHGQCGLGYTSPHESLLKPVNLTGVLKDKAIRQASAGSVHSLLLTLKGEVISFGSNEYAQLGQNRTGSEAEPTPQLVNMKNISQKRVIQVAAAAYHNLLLMSDGSVFSFGRNDGGQCGLNYTSFAVLLPTRIALSAAEEKIEKISAGGAHNLLLTFGGKLITFGAIHAKFGSFSSTPTPLNSNEQLKPLSVSGNLDHYMYSDTSGAVYASVDNTYGQLGDETFITRTDIRSVSGELPKMYQVATGTSHSLLLSSSGEPFTFGDNHYSQLGRTKQDFFITLFPKRVDVSNVPAAHTKFVQISAGSHHNLLLSSEGIVYCFGQNPNGECGLGDEIGIAELPVPVLGALHEKKIVQISAATRTSLVLSSDGLVYCFGKNSDAECGIGTLSAKESLPVPVNTEGELNGKQIVQISASSYALNVNPITHSLLLSSEGEVFCFGRNDFGQCGIGTRTETEAHPVAVNTGGALKDKHIVQVSSGAAHSLLLSLDGSLYCFGFNMFGECGIGRTSQAEPLPVQVKLPPHIGEKVKSAKHVKITAAALASFLHTCEPIECSGLSQLHPLVCSEHGECVASEQCLCNDGWTGHDCSMPVCYGIGQNQTNICSSTEEYQSGQCVSPNECRCNLGFTGEQCEWFSCGGVLNDDPSVCSGGGSCVAPEVCLCDAMHVGTYCGSNLWYWLVIPFSCLLGVVLLCLIFTGSCGGVLLLLFSLKRAKKAEEAKKLTQNLLEGFIRDTEMDEMDADSQRARLIIQKSMLEIDFNELSEMIKIGSGGSGAILFRALWNGTQVAVKVFKCGILSGEVFFDEFEHEVSLMSTLRHRNVINFYGCSLAYPRIAIVMELCEAGSVENVIEGGSLKNKSSHELLQMLLDISEGMNYLHSRGIIHRDLKCANVLIDEHGVCKITDFGLSKFVSEEVEKAHTVGIGTSYYIAPEVARGSGEYSESVDVYAFGIMCMEILLGKMCPFPGVGSSFHAQQIHQRALDDSNFRPDVGQLDKKYGFLHWVLKLCWNVDPGLRPPFRDISKILKSSLFDTEQ